MEDVRCSAVFFKVVGSEVISVVFVEQLFEGAVMENCIHDMECLDHTSAGKLFACLTRRPADVPQFLTQATCKTMCSRIFCSAYSLMQSFLCSC